MKLVRLLLILALMPIAAAAPRIVTPVRDISRGEVIGQSDLAYAESPGAVQPGTVTAMKDIVGWETRRALRVGESLRSQDFRRPVLVTKGSTVTMIFEEPGVSLTATMRAISSGGIGETVTVQNPVSFRQVAAVVTGPGQVKALTAVSTITPSFSGGDR
jgi:flagellar basal body P-ring formation protein FlgA